MNDVTRLYDLPCVTSCKFTDKKKEWIGRDGVPDLFNVDITYKNVV
jgi:hypothetical protein